MSCSSNPSDPRALHVAVIGGGPAGLACATLLARRAGPTPLRVTVLERAAQLGGRARSDRSHGFSVNRGPHALYRGGAAQRVLGRLGVELEGRPPAPRGLAVYDDVVHALPSSTWTLLRTGLLSWSAKREFGALLAKLDRVDASRLADRSAASWVQEMTTSHAARALLAQILRLSSYCADLERASADALVGQLQLALSSGVRYLDGGWQSMVDALAGAARTAGVTVRTSAAITELRRCDDHRLEIVLDGPAHETLPVDAAVLAVGPDAARGVLADAAPPALRDAGAAPVYASCLDLCLSRRPRPRAPSFALDLDRHLYYSDHATTADVAPGGRSGGAMLHVMRYGGPVDDVGGHPDTTRAQLEALAQRVQPGWRDHTVSARFLPRMTVIHDAPTPDRGGLPGRTPARLEGSGRLWATGDWVGDEGMLLDAALASAARVADTLDLQALGAAVNSEAA